MVSRLFVVLMVLGSGCAIDRSSDIAPWGDAAAARDGGLDGGAAGDGSPPDDTAVDAPPTVTDAPPTGTDAPLPMDTGPDCTCPLGCNAKGGCVLIVPSGLSSVDLTDVVVAAVTDASPDTVEWLFDTDTGEISARDASGVGSAIRGPGEGVIDGILYQREDGAMATVGAFGFESLEISSDTTLRGRGSRALAIVTRGDVVVAGALDVGALDTPGPGGGAAGSADSGDGGGPGGGGGGSCDSNGDGGGAGGSYGSVGGAGGSATGGLPGPVYGNPELNPLLGGSGGGGGADPDGGRGGPGGGAVQLSASGRIHVTATGTINAGGGAGIGGRTNDAGGGGGSGGGILLEAAVVLIEGRVAANGGSGGQGAPSDTQAGADGTHGTAELVPAPGSSSSGNGGGGGDGSDEAGLARPGDAATNGGGGGGGAGRIRINTRTGAETFASGLSPATASGLATVGTLVATE